jgi:hypothetical protein
MSSARSSTLRLLIALCWGLTAAWLSCTTSGQIAGGGTETGDVTSVAGVVYQSDGVSPAAFAGVQMLPAATDPLEGGPGFGTTADGEGHYLFDSIPSAVCEQHFNLVAWLNGTVCLADSIYVSRNRTNSVPALTLAASGAIRGVVRFSDANDLRRVRIALLGTVIATVPDAVDGSFFLSDLAPASYRCRITDIDKRYAPVETTITVGAGDTASFADTVVLEPTALLLDDFDDRDRFSFLQPVVDSSYWAAWDYPLPSQNSFLPAEIMSDFTLGLTDSTAFAGSSVHVRFALKPNVPNASSGVECLFGAPGDSTYVDCTPLKAISFYLKGRDSIRVSFTSKKVLQYPASRNYGQLGTIVVCTPTWRKVTIPVAELMPQPGSPQDADSLRWQDVRDNISKVSFGSWGQPGDTVEMWIDDITLHGMVREDFRH